MSRLVLYAGMSLIVPDYVYDILFPKLCLDQSVRPYMFLHPCINRALWILKSLARHCTLNFTTLFAQLYSVVPFSLSAVDNQVTVEYIYYREKIPQMRNTLRYRLLFSFLSFHFSDQCGALAQCPE